MIIYEEKEAISSHHNHICLSTGAPRLRTDQGVEGQVEGHRRSWQSKQSSCNPDLRWPELTVTVKKLQNVVGTSWMSSEWRGTGGTAAKHSGKEGGSAEEVNQRLY